MNSTECDAAIRASAYIGDVGKYPEYTAQRLLTELNNKQQSVFEDIVVKARAGYWVHDIVINTTAGKNRYRIPSRSVVGGLEKVEVATVVGGPFYKLDEVPISIAQNYEGNPGRTGNPVVYCIFGDQVELIPAPSVVVPLRLTYYARPSVIWPQQSSTIGGTVRGQVTVVNVNTRQVTVAVLPFDQSLAVPAPIVTTQRIDIVHPNGWHELSMIDQPQTLAGGGPFVFTIGGTDDMGDIEIGDFVRVADQTDWPTLPDDFHRPLCDTAAIKILIEQNLTEKAAVLADNNGNDIIRFKSLLEPRVKAEPKQIGIMRRSRGGWSNGRIY